MQGLIIISVTTASLMTTLAWWQPQHVKAAAPHSDNSFHTLPTSACDVCLEDNAICVATSAQGKNAREKAQ